MGRTRFALFLGLGLVLLVSLMIVVSHLRDDTESTGRSVPQYSSPKVAVAPSIDLSSGLAGPLRGLSGKADSSIVPAKQARSNQPSDHVLVFRLVQSTEVMSISLWLSSDNSVRELDARLPTETMGLTEFHSDPVFVPEEGVAFVAFSAKTVPLAGLIKWKDGFATLDNRPRIEGQAPSRWSFVREDLRSLGLMPALDLATRENSDSKTTPDRLPVLRIRSAAFLRVVSECRVGRTIPVGDGIEYYVNWKSPSSDQTSSGETLTWRDFPEIAATPERRFLVPSGSVVGLHLSKLPGETVATPPSETTFSLRPGEVQTIVLRRADAELVRVRVSSVEGPSITSATVVAAVVEGVPPPVGRELSEPGEYEMLLTDGCLGVVVSAAGFLTGQTRIHMPHAPEVVNVALSPATAHRNEITLKFAFPVGHELFDKGIPGKIEVASEENEEAFGVKLPSRSIFSDILLSPPVSKHILLTSGRVTPVVSGQDFLATLIQVQRGEEETQFDYLVYPMGFLDVVSTNEGGRSHTRKWTAQASFQRLWDSVQNSQVEGAKALFELRSQPTKVRLPVGRYEILAIDSEGNWACEDVEITGEIQQVKLTFARKATVAEIEIDDPTGEFTALGTVFASRLGPPSSLADIRADQESRQRLKNLAMAEEGAHKDGLARLHWQPAKSSTWVSPAGVVVTPRYVTLPANGRTEWHAISPSSSFAVFEIDWYAKTAKRLGIDNEAIVYLHPGPSDSSATPQVNPESSVDTSKYRWLLLRECRGPRDLQSIAFQGMYVPVSRDGTATIKGVPNGTYAVRYFGTIDKPDGGSALAFSWDAVAQFTIHNGEKLSVAVPVPK